VARPAAGSGGQGVGSPRLGQRSSMHSDGTSASKFSG
jgi:hypothetical protein